MKIQTDESRQEGMSGRTWLDGDKEHIKSIDLSQEDVQVR